MEALSMQEQQLTRLHGLFPIGAGARRTTEAPSFVASPN
jgi:hypothetical protein